MALDRLTQITASGISSTSPLTGINITGVITATSITATNYGSVNATTINASGVSTFQASSFWGDGDVAYFGDGQDLLIFHNSTDSIIRDTGTGDLFIEGGNRIKMTNPTGIETYAVFNQDGAAELWYDNSKKLETSGIGVTVTGRLDVGTINATGVSTFTSGPIFIGSGTSTGTASQPLQVTGGAYISGNVGINSTSPGAKLDVADSGASGSVIRSRVTTNNGGYLAYEALNSSGTSVFSVTHNGRINLSENIVFASGQGLDFSATANSSSGTMTSELLNDYEEGTWTPYWSNINGTNLFVNNDLTIYHANYVRINDTCFYQAHFTSDSSFSYNTGITGSTQAFIAGLPFSPKTTPGGSAGYYGGYCGYYGGLTSYDTGSYGFTPMIITENTYPVLRLQYPTTNGSTNWSASFLFSSGSAIIVGGSYKIA